MFCSATAVIDQGFFFNRCMAGSSSNLTAPDTMALLSLFCKAFLCHLANVAVYGSGYNEFCRDVALNPLKSDIFGKSLFGIGEKIDEVIFIIRFVLSRFPEFFKLCSGCYERWIYLEKIWAEPWICEERIKHFLIARNAAAIEIWHDMEPHFDPSITQ